MQTGLTTCVGQLEGFRLGRAKIRFAFDRSPGNWEGQARPAPGEEADELCGPDELRTWVRILAIGMKRRVDLRNIHR